MSTSGEKVLMANGATWLNYHGCMVPDPMWETLPEIEAFDSQPGDVVIVSFPKCGTTLTMAVVHMIQNNADPLCLLTGGPLEQKIRYFEMIQLIAIGDMPAGTRVVDVLKAQKPPRTFYTHLGYNALPASLLKNAKIIYVTRNPKDTIVSTHHFLRSIPRITFTGTIEDTFETFVKNECWSAPYFDHVAEFWSHHKSAENILFVTFEDLLKNFQQTTKNLARFLGKDLTEQQMDSLVYHCNFEQMKINENVNRNIQAEAGFFDFSISPFMRAGKVGNWKEQFSPELNVQVDEWITKEQTRLRNKLEGLNFQYT